MNAVEFVKKFGWEEAKKKNSEGDDFYVWRRDKEFFKDLNRLVESHELVESCGGLQSVGEKLTHGLYESRAVIERLKQAIADVESCK